MISIQTVVGTLYGYVVRLSPSELSYISSDAWKDTYGHSAGGRARLVKDAASTSLPPDVEPSMLQTLDDASHHRQRQVFAPAFSNRALKEQEPLLLKHVNLLISKLQESSAESDGRVNILDMFNFITFDIMSDLTFGTPLGLLANTEYTPWVRVTFGAIKLLHYRVSLTYYMPILNKIIPHLLPRSLHRKRKEHLKYSTDLVDGRLATKTDRPDIWTLVLNSQDGETSTPKLTMGEMHSNASVFMIAGTETTATLLSGAIHQLLKNPECMKKLTQEIRREFERTEDMTLESLPRLPYLNAVLEESLRFYPPGPDILPRRVPPQGIDICNRFVPGETTVFVHQYPAYRSARNFALPDAFLPERWLPDSDPRFAKDEKKVLQPFSVGPRNCLGKNLAYHEMRIILSKILWHFDLSLCPESDDWMDQLSFTLWEKGPLIVKVSPVARA